MVPLKAGDTLAFGEAVIRIVSPKNEPYEDLNNASLALVIEHEGHKILVAGDMEREAESLLCEDESLAQQIRDMDLLRVGHHGSNSSTSYRFLDLTYPKIAVNGKNTTYACKVLDNGQIEHLYYGPKIAVISVGADNPYGHPSENVLSRLADLGRSRSGGITVLRTDEEGDISFVSDPDGIKRIK